MKSTRTVWVASLALLVCLALATGAFAFPYNNELDLTTAQLGTLIASLEPDPGNPSDPTHFTIEMDSNLMLEGYVSSYVYWNSSANYTTFIYKIELTDGMYGSGYDMVDHFHAATTWPEFIQDAGYVKQSDSYSISTQYSASAEYYRWYYPSDYADPNAFALYDTASVWLRTDGCAAIKDGLADISTPGGNGFTTVYLPVPEPATLMLLAAGGAALALIVRRRLR